MFLWVMTLAALPSPMHFVLCCVCITLLSSGGAAKKIDANDRRHAGKGKSSTIVRNQLWCTPTTSSDTTTSHSSCMRFIYVNLYIQSVDNHNYRTYVNTTRIAVLYISNDIKNIIMICWWLTSRTK